VHVAVLAGPAVEWLNVRGDGTYVDCTVGAAGHAERIAEQLAGFSSSQGRLIALDRDPAAVAVAEKRLSRFSFATVQQANYGELDTVLARLGIARVDGVLIDAGISSMQLDEDARGFSFQRDGPLDMRMDTTQTTTASTLLASVDERELVRVLKEYGDVRPARRIAKAILERLARGALATTGDLAEAVREALPFVHGVPSETRSVFQAIRIAVNEELRWLERGLKSAVELLAPMARLVIISFHSGEDRIVKNVLRRASRKQTEFHLDGRTRRIWPPRLRLLTPKPILPDAEEVRQNPRAHSAKLRAAERLADDGGQA